MLNPCVNPWLALPHNGEFLLPVDKEAVRQFNRRARSDYKLQLDLLPEPFLGNLDKCSVLILSGNPGFDETRDKSTHAREDFSEASFLNLRGRSGGNFFLEDRFQDTPGGVWWRRCFNRLLGEGLTWDQIRPAIAVIEHHPYHARKWCLPAGLRDLPSFEFVKCKIVAALDQGSNSSLIVIQRAHELWKMRIPRLSDPRNLNVIETRHTQSMKLTRNKMENDRDWKRIVDAVRAHDHA